MSKNVVVVGMPRSGTSLTAGIFVRQGYFLAENGMDELQKADAHNPFGYFEAGSLVGSNAKIFSRAGFKHDNTWLYSEIPAEVADLIPKLTPDQADQALVEKYNRNTPWIWKDPRLCYTLGYWWQMLDPGTTAVLLIKRNSEDIFQSFVRLGWRAPGNAGRQEVEKRVLNHWQAAEKAIVEFKIPCLTIDYSDYQRDPVDVVCRINDVFGLALDVSDLNFHKELNHSTLKSKIIIALTRKLTLLPFPLWQLTKTLIPKFLMLRLFPEKRFEKASPKGRERPSMISSNNDCQNPEAARPQQHI